jgi:dihydroorotase
MEQHDLVLNLHGEWPGPLPNDDISLEEAFLPELKKLHEKFPRLRCVLEVGRSLLAYNAVVTHYSIVLPLRL